ncbi:hypothetical protein EV126DRAFT_27377 [Verticillium dahliae]|nr:hypothetical protein EV126DRAFT_27377 [Verticillium dahliae]
MVDWAGRKELEGLFVVPLAIGPLLFHHVASQLCQASKDVKQKSNMDPRSGGLVSRDFDAPTRTMKETAQRAIDAIQSRGWTEALSEATAFQ